MYCQARTDVDTLLEWAQAQGAWGEELHQRLVKLEEISGTTSQNVNSFHAHPN